MSPLRAVAPPAAAFGRRPGASSTAQSSSFWSLSRAHFIQQPSDLFFLLRHSAPARRSRWSLIVGHLDFQDVNHLVVLSIQREQREAILDCRRGDERIEDVKPV
jgi:hypothetical protein